MIHSTAIWAKSYGLENRVSLLVDHGSVPAGYYFKDRGLSIIFAGKKLKADDVIVRDIPFCQDKLNRDVVVITQDYELIQRCKRAAHRSGGKEMSIIRKFNIQEALCIILSSFHENKNSSLFCMFLVTVTAPLFFLADLQNVVGDNLLQNIEFEENDCPSEEEEEESSSENMIEDKITADVELEITLGAKLIAVESQLRNKAKTRKSQKHISTSKCLNIMHYANHINHSHIYLTKLVRQKRERSWKSRQKK